MFVVCSLSVTVGTHWVPRTDWIGSNKTSGERRLQVVSKVVFEVVGGGRDRKLVKVMSPQHSLI